ncbi:MAG: ATP-binding protein, partial [Psychromonas sp.]|nr:ATP-binding protein [Psychromonas sp.]
MVERTLISFPSQLQLIERLQHLLYLSSSMVFISGEKGSGKSTLIEQLSNQLPNQTQQAFITLSEPSTVAQVRQQIISQLFDPPLFDADDRLTNSLLILKEKQSEDVARVVVIDNAQLLPEQILIELAEVIKQKAFITDHEINFILLSDESTNKRFIDSINSSVDHQSVSTLTFKLAPLSNGEAKQLLNHRFVQVGYSAQVEHKDALTKQLLACQGIPEKILT